MLISGQFIECIKSRKSENRDFFIQVLTTETPTSLYSWGSPFKYPVVKNVRQGEILKRISKYDTWTNLGDTRTDL